VRDRRDLLRVFYLPAEQCQLAKRAQPRCQCLPVPLKPEIEDTHVPFIRRVAPTPRSESSELLNLRRNAAEGLPQKKFKTCTDWH